MSVVMRNGELFCQQLLSSCLPLSPFVQEQMSVCQQPVLCQKKSFLSVFTVMCKVEHDVMFATVFQV